MTQAWLSAGALKSRYLSRRVDLRPVVDGATWMEDYGVYFVLTVR